MSVEMAIGGRPSFQEMGSENWSGMPGPSRSSMSVGDGIVYLCEVDAARLQDGQLEIVVVLLLLL